MNYKLFLDDFRNAKTIYPHLEETDFIIVRSFNDFKRVIIEKGLPEFISFDNDLGLDEKGKVALDGYACAKWLVYESEIDIRNLKFKVHSANPVAKEQIKGLLNNYIKNLKNYNISFQERAKLAKKLLLKQQPITLEKAKEQCRMLKEHAKIGFARDAPMIQEGVKKIKPPLTYNNNVHIYRWLFREQITLEMLSEEVLEEFKQSELFEKYLELKNKKK
ncbi:MAG: cyclic-phosphate processing receiver domain-containing protein [Bacteroidales bacterium]|jgi:hypothetical protein